MPRLSPDLPPPDTAAPQQLPANALYDQLYQLRRGKAGEHERPHKPALLLALIDLVDAGHFTENRFPLDDAWRDRFQRYFSAVRSRNNRPNIHLPYYHLKSDWRFAAHG